MNLNDKLELIRKSDRERKIKIMIIGLGSVGNYLLDYLLSSGDENIEIIVVGRDISKLQSDVNIVRVASLIRKQIRTAVKIVGNVDLNNVSQIAQCLEENKPDIIVNSSRAYSGLKYGSISWKNIRAYGIWAPLAIKYIKNIMEAVQKTDSTAVVINTSYSDAVIPWLKTAGKCYPEFGSGNINHLIPRIKFAVADIIGINDYWNIDVTFAVSHFHDVVISKEGQTEGVSPLITVKYQGKKLNLDIKEVYQRCCIPMPVDAKRNMMNASSNYDIIRAILLTARDGSSIKLHCPGVFGEIGGYPVIIDGTSDKMKAFICEDEFSIDEMRKANRASIYLDGIEAVEDGVLIYTDELIQKVNDVFGVKLMKRVCFDEIDSAADFLIRGIIEKNR